MTMPAPVEPPNTLAPFRGPTTTVETMLQMIRGQRGERSVVVYKLTEHVVRELQPKDYLSEILAIRNFVAERVRYKNDSLTTEVVSDPQRMAEEIMEHGSTVGDCFPEGTLMLRKEGMALVPVEELQVGDKIWGYKDWSTVEAVAYKGQLSLDALLLSNGSQLQLTPEHHVYVLRCEHGYAGPEEKLCHHCGDAEWREERIRVADVREGMRLLLPERIPFGEHEPDPGRAYIEGLYVSDGWGDNHRFCISGQDGCPKEEQKREVQRICEKLGVATTWQRKYISVKDADWALALQRASGHRAPQKRVPSLDLGEGAAGALLRGVMADSGKNTGSESRTFTTTSRLLAVQTRVLHRMFGVSCGWRYIENHGGLGKNPIYRLGTRGTGMRAPWKLRVREIERDVATAPVWDIQTSDHRVYLPEHDVTVSQCDDMATLIATMARQCGREAELVIVGFGREGSYSHVFARVKEPKSNKWIVCDPVAGSDEAKMLRRVTTYKIWRTD